MEIRFRLPWKALAAGAGFFLLLLLSERVLAAGLPFLLGYLLAAAIEPAVGFLVRQARLPRHVAVALVLTLLIAVLAYFSILFVGRLVGELASAARAIPDLGQALSGVLERITNQTQGYALAMPDVLREALQSSLNQLYLRLQQLLMQLASQVVTSISALPTLVGVAMATVLSAYFFARDRNTLGAGLLRHLPARWQEPVGRALQRTHEDLLGFLKGLSLILTLSTTVSAVAFYFMGVRFWMVTALLTGVVDMIPVVGPGLFFFPWAGAALLLGNPWLAVELLLLYGYIFLQRNILQATLLGPSIGIHPLVMLGALYAGVVFFGLAGVLLGPVVAIAGKAALTALMPEPPTAAAGARPSAPRAASAAGDPRSGTTLPEAVEAGVHPPRAGRP